MVCVKNQVVNTMAESYSRYVFPAETGSWGRTSTGEYPSGIFAMHLTYPDTAYEDTIEDWESGVNSTDWRQGVTLLIRTPLAAASATIAEAQNVIAIDLKQQKADHNNALYTYDLGTEEATRFIAAKINSRRIKMKGERDLTKYLRARYIRQSLPEKYTIDSVVFQSQGSGKTVVDLEIATLNKNGFPSELTNEFSLRVASSTGSPRMADGDYENTTLRYKKAATVHSSYATIEATIPSIMTLTGSPSAGATLTNVFTLIGEPPKHTLAITWDRNTPSTNGGYWGAANGGPFIQGMGSIGVHRLVAKPMDGGNMGLPALNYDSRSGILASQHSSNHGYNRFSIEGLNSCQMPSIPPPDRVQKAPAYHGIVSLHPDTEGDLTTHGRLRIEKLDYGVELKTNHVAAPDFSVRFENSRSIFPNTNPRSNHYVATGANGVHLTDIDTAAVQTAHTLNDSSQKSYARTFRTKTETNTERVLFQISNEHRVFDDISVVDDLGNKLMLKGGSPFGTVIRDFEVLTGREDPNTGETITRPSAPNDSVPPNLKIQLPKQEDIPGGIFVRSGHDRVQAWSNQTWGMGGLSAPNPRKAGDAELNSDECSQYDTHDRTLIFHCERILHSKIQDSFGLESSVAIGTIPSGTTRLFSSHRMADHTERGSLLTQTNNGVETGNPIAHHRVRFGRQGHSFIMPLCHRGTPTSMRRQLHRSHGSAYSLMFEAETEYKHFGFGNTNTTNSATTFELDTIDVKNGSAVYSTGSFVSDGLPLDELKGMRLYDADGAYTSATHRSIPDYLFAPGQKHTNVNGTPEKVSFANTEISGSISTGGATKLTLQGSSLTGRRFNTASEMMINGFFLNNYLAIGGRPEPIKRVAIDGLGNWFVRGFHEGVIRPRVATELATVPPLMAHDPELLNVAATPQPQHATVPATSYSTADESDWADFALTKSQNTANGGTPDAFLCTWLAEYSHPVFFGTMREHFMAFRYREAGMPRSLNYPATRGLLLRNFSPNGYHVGANAGSPQIASPFERIYVNQWMQNYAYNGLNAGGHGNVEGLRGVGAVLMGHTTRREAHGTIQLYNQNGTKRYSRGEGIGDALNPNSTLAVVKGIDLDSDNEDLNRQFFVLNPCVGIDMSRRLPVRAWGIRTASNGQNMLAGDPTETQNTYAMAESGRFDGGKHDSMEDLPGNGLTAKDDAFSFDTNFRLSYGLERTVPVGFVANDFTAEAHPFEKNLNATNQKIDNIGIGATLGITQNGMLSPDSMAAGAWDYELDDNRPTTLPISNPVLWLKADSLDLKDGASVSSWIDSSPNKWEFTQGTASAQPTFIKRNSSVNNMPVIDCDGNDFLSLPFQEKLNSIETTVFVVGFVDSDDGNVHGLVESRSGTPVARSGFNLYARMDSGNEYQLWGGANSGWIQAVTPNDTAVGGEAALLTGKIFGGDGGGSTATLELYQNGYMEPSAGTVTGGFYRATGGTYQVGSVPSSYHLNGKIAEVIQYDRKLTTAEQYEVEAYLARKYDIAINPISVSYLHTGHMRPTDTKPINKGSDPFMDLVQRSGSPTYPQQDSAGGILTTDATTRFGAPSNFYKLKGNALHTNFHAYHETDSKTSYPPNGFSHTQYSGGANIVETRPDVLNEISDTRQVQARTEPRLGLIMEVESERNKNEDVSYAVTGTRALSLHTDLMLGRQFPVLPSHTIKTFLANNGFSVDGTGSTSAAPDFRIKPTWSPDSNNAKGAISGLLSTDTVRTDYKTHALDSWTVRGVSGLPAWGGVYILRKTYLNRTEENDDSLSTELDSNSNYPTSSHPQRKYVDYIVRPVRPLKLFGFASDLLQDGWVLGPRCSISTSAFASMPFDRDKRYGMFEMNYARGENKVEPITSAGSAFSIEYPNANEYDITWHLIPTANMLQFSKSDAHRIVDGQILPSVEPRYSQSFSTGGNEPIYQSETKYDLVSGVMGDHARHTFTGKVSQSKEAMRYYPRITVKASKGGGVFLVDDASILPPTGKLFALSHTGSITYTSITKNDITTTGTIVDLGGLTISDFTGLELYYTDVSSSTGVIDDARSPLVVQAISPTFIDNAVVAMKIQSQAWYHFDNEKNEVVKTPLNYRGLIAYEPSDFIMASQQPFIISNGEKGAIKNKNGLQSVKVDGRSLSSTFSPPYVIDSHNMKWRVAEIITEEGETFMVFNDLSGKTLSDSGMVVGDVIAAQNGYIGIRTTDAALHLLNDAGGNQSGISVTPSNAFHQNSRDMEEYLGAHPMLKQINDHSLEYVSREVKGLNTMEVLRNISQIDGRQIINERNGALIYSKKVFNEKGIRIGVENGVEKVSVSKLFDSPNEIVIVGDVIAGNEIVFIRVRDSEKIREASAGSEEEVVKTLRQQIPGIKSVSAARKLAKTLLARAENGAPMITLYGLINATSISAGDVVAINLPTQGVIGKFVVFEAKHSFHSLKTDLTIAQYEKGIEGILTDLKTSTIDVSGLNFSSGDKNTKENITMSSSVNIISVHRVRVRNINETGFIIGAKHKNGLGKIGVRDDSKRGFPIGMSKSRNYVVK